MALLCWLLYRHIQPPASDSHSSHTRRPIPGLCCVTAGLPSADFAMSVQLERASVMSVNRGNAQGRSSVMGAK